MNSTGIEVFENKKFLLHHVKFSVLLLLQIPAIVLSILIFIFFIKHRTDLRAPHNQALFILLLVNFIQLSFALPLPLHFYHHSYVDPATPTFCTWWTFFEFTLYVTSEYLMATISVQRHMLIFHGHILRIPWMRNVLHNLPLLLCLIYPVTFYFFAIILYSCDGTQWDYTSNLCGFADCYLLFNKVLGTFDWAFNNGLPMVVNALANLALIMRVVRQKRRFQQALTWRQQRRMTVQLLAISSLYIIAWTPCLTVGLVQILGYPTFLAQIQTDFFLDLIYVVCLFLPWVYLSLLPELTKWIKELFHYQQKRNLIAPIRTTQFQTRP
ncbi:unnamed protein product [Rotaria sp. Silwood2]|nr:unnamed protein product [Rotaria sp. Silwood2]CAF3077708.1 unnamed protein product [Rotaria sp. Silwood2]CAF3179749.1 unnamed protein product [Rotaria sp. Silwood2]CAF4370458.1 unnamed protein product [Rotaria sp. Silwood2]CAF4403122.1 unnamed protein product [Rotaria sp. Silwood2]